MPIFFQQQVNDSTRLGVWKIEETEEFFKNNVPQHRDVTHPHKRLQHLAGRFLLQFLFPDFPYDLIRVADTRKPFLSNEQFHFSISHCGDYAAAIVSRSNRVGIDIEIPVDKITRITHKFISPREHELFDTINHAANSIAFATLIWSAKESVYKWYGDGDVDFLGHIHLLKLHDANETIDCFFLKDELSLSIHYHLFEKLVLTWVLS